MDLHNGRQWHDLGYPPFNFHGDPGLARSDNDARKQWVIIAGLLKCNALSDPLCLLTALANAPF
jgi:hypothetical protein